MNGNKQVNGRILSLTGEVFNRKYGREIFSQLSTTRVTTLFRMNSDRLRVRLKHTVVLISFQGWF